MIKSYTHICNKTCSRSIEIFYDEALYIKDIKINGGCPGNTQGVIALSKGRKLEEVMNTLKGIDCRSRGTSCPNELALGIEEILKMENSK